MFHRDSLLYFEIEPNNNTNSSYVTSSTVPVNNTDSSIRISGELKNIVDDIHKSINYILHNIQDLDMLKKLANLIFDNNKIVENSSISNDGILTDKTVVKTYNVMKETQSGTNYKISNAKYSKYTIILRKLHTEFKNYNKMSSEKMSNMQETGNQVTLKRETILNIINAHDKPSKSNIGDLLTLENIFDLTIPDGITPQLWEKFEEDMDDLVSNNNELISHLLRLCLFSDGKYDIIDNIFINPNNDNTFDESIGDNFELYYICNMCFSPSLGVIGTYYYNKYISNGNLNTLQPPGQGNERYYIKNILKDSSFELVKIEYDDTISNGGDMTTTIEEIMNRHKLKIPDRSDNSAQPVSDDDQLGRIVLPSRKILNNLINSDIRSSYNINLTPGNLSTEKQIKQFQIPCLAHHNTGTKSKMCCWVPLKDQNSSLKLDVYKDDSMVGGITGRTEEPNSSKIMIPELGEELITNKQFENILGKVTNYYSTQGTNIDLKSNSFYAFTPYHLTHSYHPFYLSIDIDIFGYKSHHFVKYLNQIDLFKHKTNNNLTIQYNEYLDYTFGVQEGFLDDNNIYEFEEAYEPRNRKYMTIFIKNPMTDFIYMEASLKHNATDSSDQSNAFLNIGCRMLLTDEKMKNTWIPPQCKFTNLKKMKDVNNNKLPVQIGNDMKNFHPGESVESHLEKNHPDMSLGDVENYGRYLKGIYEQEVYISNNDVRPDTDNIDTWWLNQGVITITGKKIGYFATIHDYSRKVCIVANQMSGFEEQPDGSDKCNKIGDSILRNARDFNDNILFNEHDILKDDHILSIGADPSNLSNGMTIYGVEIDNNFGSTFYYINGVTILNGESVLNKNCEIELISFAGLDGLEGNDTFLYDSSLSEYFDERVNSNQQTGLSDIKHQQVMSHCGTGRIPQYYKHTALDMNIQALLMNIQRDQTLEAKLKQWALTGMVYYTKKAPQWDDNCSCGLESNSGDQLHYIRPWLIQKVIGNERYILVNKITSADSDTSLHGKYFTDPKFSQITNDQIKLGSPLFVNLKLILKSYNYKEFIKNCVFNIFNTHYNPDNSDPVTTQNFQDRIVIRSIYPIYSRRHLYRFSDLYSNDGTKYLTHKYLQIANINGNDDIKRLTVNPSSSWEMCFSASNHKGIDDDKQYYRDRTKRLQPDIWHLGRLPTGMSSLEDRPRCFLGAGDKDDPPDPSMPIYKKSNVQSSQKVISTVESQDYGLITATQLPPTLRNTAFIRTPEDGNLSTETPIQCTFPDPLIRRSAREPNSLSDDRDKQLPGVIGDIGVTVGGEVGNQIVVTTYPALELELHSDIIIDGVKNEDLCLFNQTDARGLDPLCVPNSTADKFDGVTGACSDSKHGYYWGNTYRQVNQPDDDGPGPMYSKVHDDPNDQDNGEGDIYRCSVLSESAGFNLPLISKLHDYLLANGVTNGFWGDIFDENEPNMEYDFDTGIADTPYVPPGNNNYFTLNGVNDKSVLEGKGQNIFNPERGNVNNLGVNYNYNDAYGGERSGYSLNRACDFKIIEYNSEINSEINNNIMGVPNINFVSMEPVSQSFTNFLYFYPVA